MRTGYHRFARPDGCKWPAFRFQARACSTMDCSCDPTTNPQLGVGRIDNGFHIRLIRNISFNTFNFYAM